MSLIRCPECNKKISEAAEICPHCGYGVNKPGVIVEEKEIMKIGADLKGTYIRFAIASIFFVAALILLGILFFPIIKGYYILVCLLLVLIFSIKIIYEIYREKTTVLILTNKRITGKWLTGFFKIVDIDYPLTAIKNITTNSFFKTGSISITFREGFLSTYWIKFPHMQNVKEFKNKFFEIKK